MDLFSLAPRLYGKSLGAHQVVNDAICCQLSIRSKDKMGALAACRVRDDGREGPSLSALHRMMKLTGIH